MSNTKPFSEKKDKPFDLRDLTHHFPVVGYIYSLDHKPGEELATRSLRFLVTLLEPVMVMNNLRVAGFHEYYPEDPKKMVVVVDQANQPGTIVVFIRVRALHDHTKFVEINHIFAFSILEKIADHRYIGSCGGAKKPNEADLENLAKFKNKLQADYCQAHGLVNIWAEVKPFDKHA